MIISQATTTPPQMSTDIAAMTADLALMQPDTALIEGNTSDTASSTAGIVIDTGLMVPDLDAIRINTAAAEVTLDAILVKQGLIEAQLNRSPLFQNAVGTGAVAQGVVARWTKTVTAAAETRGLIFTVPANKVLYAAYISVMFFAEGNPTLRNVVLGVKDANSSSEDTWMLRETVTLAPNTLYSSQHILPAAYYNEGFDFYSAMSAGVLDADVSSRGVMIGFLVTKP